MTHPDGEISLFNDSWCGEVPTIKNFIFEIPTLSKLEVLDQAGYARLQNRQDFCIV